MIKYFLVIILSCCVFINATAQLLFDTAASYDYMVKKVLLEEKSDLIIKNIRYTGKDFSVASFKSKTPTGLIDSGLVLSTGKVFDARGPNQLVNTGVRSSGRSDVALQSIATGVVTDAAILEFDLLALRDSISFDYVFASEEYPEYVDKGVNDIFGFFISEEGSKIPRSLNIAKLPDNKTVVSIDNVNHRRNEEYFLRSDFMNAHDSKFWEEHKEMMLRAYIFEFDGFTTMLTAGIKLKEGKWYHLKIAIADVGDRYFDSAVFLKANSMRSKGNRIEMADSIVVDLIKEKGFPVDNLKIESEGKIKFSLNVNFNSNESIILNDSYKDLEKVVDLMETHNDLKLQLIGHTDNVGEVESNQILSENRSKSVNNFLIKRGIESKRIRSSGKGELNPIMSNNTEEGRFINRRVEFNLSF